MMTKGKGSKPGYRELKNDIGTGNIRRLYIFHGEEAYLREFCLIKLREKLVTPGMEGFNYHAFDGRGLSLPALEDAVITLPAMGGGKLVAVRDYDLFKADAASGSFLESLFDRIPEECCLVFLYDQLEYKPDARRKLAGAVGRNGLEVEFARQSAEDLVVWIKRRFQALDKQIDARQAEYLIFLCGGLMTGLVAEIGKIAAYAKGDAVSRADIDAVAVPELDAAVYDMTGAIASARFDRAMKILQELFEMKTEPVPLLAAVGRQLRQLYSARLILDARRGAPYLMKLWGFRSPYPAERLLKDASGLELAWCRRAVSLCAQADVELKSGGGDKRRTVETLLFKLSMREGAR